jgi:hypothetical protein
VVAARKLLETMTTMAGSAACERWTSPRDRGANRLCGSTRELGSDDEKRTSFDTPAYRAPIFAAVPSKVQHAMTVRLPFGDRLIVLLSAADSRYAGAGARVWDLDAVEVVRRDRVPNAIPFDGLKIDKPVVAEIEHYRAFSAG